MLLGLHGASALKILAIFSLNYALAKSLGGKGVMPFAVWGFNVAILFLNEIHDGYRFASIHSSLDFLVGQIFALCGECLSSMAIRTVIKDSTPVGLSLSILLSFA